MSSDDKNCSICQRPLGNGKRPEVTLSCKHRFHHQCAKQLLDNENSKHCPICRRRLALEDALKVGDKVVDYKRHAFGSSKSGINMFLCTQKVSTL